MPSKGTDASPAANGARATTDLAAARQPLLEVDALAVSYQARQRKKGRGQVIALDGVNLDILPGESVAVVGESGSGKSTLARTVVGLVRPMSGHIRFLGEDIVAASPTRLREIRRQVQMVFQDPYGSVNPKSTVGAVVSEPLENYHRDWGRVRRRAFVAELLSRVRLPDEMMDRPVFGLSGGQLQRVGIARALALGPRLLVADEPVSALDVSIQARILSLLADLKESEHLSLLFITHNLAVAQFIADRIAVVYAGRVMEFGDANEVIESPQHPYTKELLAAIPGVRAERRTNSEAIDTSARPGQVGCPFRTRCPHASDVCSTETPPLEPKASLTRLVACHHVPAATGNGYLPR